MSTWHGILIEPSATIRNAIEAIDRGGMQLVLVVTPEGRLLGTVSDGDVRRAILKGKGLGDPVSDIMNRSPIVSRPGHDRESILSAMREKQIHRIPVVDSENRVVGLETFDELVRPVRQDNPVILMAGGLGKRLHPLTNDRPKPMLSIGGKPILETILQGFVEQGFHRFYISVNYKAEIIKNHFGDGGQWNVDIRYLHETSSMGTVGCLSLLPEMPAEPVIVMNGDVLTKVNFHPLLDFHRSHHAGATMCVREYDFQVPYGVVQLENHRLVAIEEKPIQRFFVSAGIYVLDPVALTLLPKNARFDMPSLFEKMMRTGMETVVFPIHEYWLDVGQPADFEKANGDFDIHFQR